MWKAADLGSHQRFKASRHPLVEFLWAIQRSMVRVMRRLALGLGLALAAVHPFDFTMPAKRTADGAAAGHPAATALRARGFGGGASPKDAGHTRGPLHGGCGGWKRCCHVGVWRSKTVDILEVGNQTANMIWTDPGS